MRPRKQQRHLPPCMYEKHGAFWFVKRGKWTRLGTDQAAALRKYAEIAAVAGRNGQNAYCHKADSPATVQKESPESAPEKAGISRTTAEVLDSGLVPVATAAEALGIPEKRLIGFILRNGLRDPIGGWKDGGMAVYGWSCREIAASTSSEIGKTP